MPSLTALFTSGCSSLAFDRNADLICSSLASSSTPRISYKEASRSTAPQTTAPAAAATFRRRCRRLAGWYELKLEFAHAYRCPVRTAARLAIGCDEMHGGCDQKGAVAACAARGPVWQAARCRDAASCLIYVCRPLLRAHARWHAIAKLQLAWCAFALLQCVLRSELYP